VTEFMMNALRLTAGIPSRLFAERTGLPISVVATPLEQAEHRGLITWDTESLRPTDAGFRYLNNLVELF
jgi:coproporphyrinogen III oxidase-like Fe-S oxidoreductase